MYDADRLAQLIAISAAAYERAREVVYDAMPPGARVDRSSLSPSQCAALDSLAMVEAELADYRFKAYAA